MKPSTVLVATLAALTTASALPPQSPHPIQDRSGINLGTDFTSGLLEMIAKFPGTKEIKQSFLCLRKDKTWEVDYSHKGEGIVYFSNVPTKCCKPVQEGWKKYHEAWSKFTTPVINDDCSGGALTKMKLTHIDKLHRMIGDGHRAL